MRMRDGSTVHHQCRCQSCGGYAYEDEFAGEWTRTWLHSCDEDWQERPHHVQVIAPVIITRRGAQRTVRYRHSGGFVMDVAYYVEQVETTNLPEVRTAYVVSEQDHSGLPFTSDGEAGDWYDEDYSYEDGSPLYYDTIEAAEAVARNLAAEDESWKLGEPNYPGTNKTE